MNIWLQIPWLKRIERAKNNKSFTQDDKRLAQLWITNPIAEFADVIEFNDGQLYKGPKDLHLVLDGIHFIRGTEENDVDLSYNCYVAMCQRIYKMCNRNNVLDGFYNDFEKMCQRVEKKDKSNG